MNNLISHTSNKFAKVKTLKKLFVFLCIWMSLLKLCQHLIMKECLHRKQKKTKIASKCPNLSGKGGQIALWSRPTMQINHLTGRSFVRVLDQDKFFLFLLYNISSRYLNFHIRAKASVSKGKGWIRNSLYNGWISSTHIHIYVPSWIWT